MKVVAGVDVGGTTVKIGLFDVDGSLLDKGSIATQVDRGADFILQRIANKILEMVRDRGLQREDLLGIGIGIPGPVLHEEYVELCVNLNWKQVHVGELLREKIQRPVYVENDANVAALGEIWQGAGANRDSLVLLTLGTGVGGGIVVHNRVISGFHGAGGEVGHIPVLDQPVARTCGCGKHDCAELAVSATGIVAYCGELMEKEREDSSLRHYNGGYDARAIFMAAEKGDPVAEKVVDHTGRILGKTLAIIGGVIDPEVFVIGGGVSRAGEILLQPTRKYYKKYCFSSGRETPILSAKLGNDAGIFGAARLALTYFGEQLIGEKNHGPIL